MVRHEVVVEPDGTVDLDTDPEGKMLAYLEFQNNLCCNMLTLKGFNGKDFWLNAPRITKAKTTTVTVPQTKARIEAIAVTKSTGQFFHATGGSHLNSGEYFKIRVLLQCKEWIKELEKEKEGVVNRTNVQCQKDTRLRTKGNDLTWETATSFNVTEIKVLVRWKINKVPPGNKRALIDMYLELTNPPEIISWSDEKEQEVQYFHNTGIDMKETAVAISTKQMANSVCNNVNILNTPENKRLLHSLQDESQSEDA